MTTISFNDFRSYSPAPSTVLTPKLSFAARLAALQDAREQAPDLTSLFGVAARFAVAVVPFAALAWVFVTI